MTTNDKPKDAIEEPRPATPRGRQASRQAPRPVEPRPRRYMVAALPQPDPAAPAYDDDTVRRLLEDDPEVRVLRRVRGRAAGNPGATVPGFPAVVVAETTPEHVEALRRQYPQLHVERDRLLTYSEVPRPPRRRRPAPVVAPPGLESTFAVLVRDADGTPLPGASVLVTGHGWPGQAVTGADGRAVVTMAGETPESITGLTVRPRSGYWSMHVERPALSTTRDNLVEPVRLAETFGGFPDRQVFGWGQQAMNLDRLPPTLRGAGVRIAIVDSGADVRHPDLRERVRAGIDLVDAEPEGWTADTAYHGSHCAAVISGADDGRGIVGFAVEAEVHACKIFPGGRFSDLIEALDYCVEQRVDVVNLSLASRHHSPLVAAKIDQAREAGVACVVAAGNDGGPVAFPGTLPGVLTVAAVGKADAFPPGTAHEAEIDGPVTGDGYFSPRFTCRGPEIDVCAPGVAVLSAVPPDAYAVLDGTSMAAPHVAGLAALVLAHHGDFRAAYAARDARRVDRLFQIITSSCVPLNLGDVHRTGAGMPNALRALAPALAQITPEPAGTDTLLGHLAAEMTEAGLLAPAPVGPGGRSGHPGQLGPVGPGAQHGLAGQAAYGAGGTANGPLSGGSLPGGLAPGGARGEAKGGVSGLDPRGGAGGTGSAGRRGSGPSGGPSATRSYATGSTPGRAQGARGGAGEAAPEVDVTTGGAARTANGSPAAAPGSPIGSPMGPPMGPLMGSGTGAPIGAAPYEQAALAWLAEEMRAAGLIGSRPWPDM
ncbi:S8 family serine peptidase [Microbispora cellulosiformans]|uniref:S8 family serine peptidase n=1 Tax=Microbispora cellulosiformans TaxID=2614688 RepID=A0A5J5K7P7_9ACTN|nr:S8 family serine peptidase [Microbispora cellulosiformans]KAA9380780.1 S8 family serine peptidase [Microbispora cellulosiformans]